MVPGAFKLLSGIMVQLPLNAYWLWAVFGASEVGHRQNMMIYFWEKKLDEISTSLDALILLQNADMSVYIQTTK
jgi:hypothetical protein